MNVKYVFVCPNLQESPFSKVRFPKCSVVGGSGILVNSKCGESIDGADFIFR